MSDVPLNGAAIGKVVGYKSRWNPMAHESCVVVMVNEAKISVSIDMRQQKFVQKEFPVGSQVAVAFYGGEWHIGSKPTEENLLVFESGVSIQEVIDSLQKVDASPS